MKLLASIIIYYPVLNDLKNNIESFIAHVDKLIVWDNTPGQSNQQIYIMLRNLHNRYPNKISIYSTKTNEGISKPLNKIAKWGLSNNFTHLLTMDQDPRWVNFKAYIDNAKKHYKDFGSNWIIGPNTNKCVPINNNPQIDYFETDAIITSGTLMPLDLLHKIGFYYENFFLDAIDNEICFRAKKMGHKVAILTHHNLIHQLSIPGTFKILKTTYNLSNYRAKRLYGVVKNAIIVSRLYPEQTNFKISILKKTYLRRWPIGIILKENNKIPKLWAIIKAIIIGYTTNLNQQKPQPKS